MNSSKRAASPPAWGRALVGLCGLMLCLATSAEAQYPLPVNPVPVNPVPVNPAPTAPGVISLAGIGDVAQISNTGFRLMFGAPYEAGAVWRVDKQAVASGFQSTFQFQISGIGGIVDSSPFGLQQGGDGFAFVIQNYGIPVVGPPAGFLGYDGIPNSLAVEFDTWWNGEPGFLDPNGNHISVHTRGTAPNSVSEAASLGQATAIPFLKDGAVHLASINYTPGTLSVFVDNLTTPVLTIGLNLSTLLSLDNGSAWVGFTSGTGATWENHDILSWQFGQASIPVSPGGVFPTTPTTPYVPPTSSPSPPATGAGGGTFTFTFPPNP
jgi:hypothetical protein